MLTKKDKSIIQSYFEDSSNIKGGHADEVLIPENVNEISSILRKSNEKNIPVTVSGAGTGQAGARIPFGGTVLSSEKLNSIKEIKKFNENGSVIVESGVIIKDLKTAANEKKLFYAYDPTEQTAFLGGTIATNASGARSFRYGPTRKYVKALKIALASGSILSIKRGDIKAKGYLFEFSAGSNDYKFNLPTYKMPNTKNSAGYFSKKNADLVDLFIGQEGTLGVILEAEVTLIDKPNSFFSCFAFFKDEVNSWNFVEKARSANPLAIEYFDKNSLKLLQEKYGNVPPGINAAIFFEDEISKKEDTVINKWEKLLKEHGVSLDDTWVAMNEKAHKDFLDKRHHIPEKMSELAKRSGFPKVSTDLAVPNDKAIDMFKFYRSSLDKSNLRSFVFGHIGDAHLHVNMLAKDENEYKIAKDLQFKFVKKSVSLGGTVSAEHGIGKTKKSFLKLLYGEKGIKEMMSVKKALDPNLILGRGNIFDFF